MMVEGLMEDLPLPALFEQARQIHSTASESSVDQDTLRKGIELLRQCDEMVSKLGLFSSNETKDDVNTTNLKYLLVPFYLGELTEKLSQENRIPVIKSAQDQLKEFVSTCEALDLVPEEELEASRRGAADTFANLRAKKIVRFKRQKAAEAKLQEIRERKERKKRSLRAAALSSPVEFNEDDSLDDDGEEEREAWLSTICLALCKAFDLLEMLKKEEEMLLAVKERQSEDGGEEEFAREVLDSRLQKRESWHKNAATSAPLAKPAEPIRCATFAQDVIEGRASISQAGDHKHHHQHQPVIFGPSSVINRSFNSDRERLAAQVFQPGYRLPTMSIEEAGMKEMEMMNKFTEMNTKMMEDARSAWHREGTGLTAEEEEEMEEDKARAWDDWKDHNPRGAGNKKLTPCG